MSSKISFRKVMGENFRNRIWLIVFFAIISFLAFPIFAHFSLQTIAHDAAFYNYEANETASFRSDISLVLFGTKNAGMHVFCIAGAVLSALTGYAFLHSKEKSDFYQSLGIKRWKQHLARFICGWLIFVIPYVANVIITYFVVLPVNGAFDSVSASVVFSAMGLFVLGFTAIYATCVLACVLTGRIIVALILMAMIFVYVPVCRVALMRMINATYDKLYIPDMYGFAGEIYSPVGAMIRAAFDGYSPLIPMIALAVWAAATFILSIIVYRYRPSEAAGRAASFALLKPVVKIAFGIAVGLAAGTLASDLSSYQNGLGFAGGWFWFWSILVVVLVQIVLEAIYNKDLKSIFKHWKSFLIMLGGMIAATVIILSDPLGANVWFPKKEDVAKMGIYNGEYSYSDFTGAHIMASNEMTSSYFGNFWVNGYTQDINEDDLMLEDFSELYEYADSVKNQENDNYYGKSIIAFQLKNGSVKYRVYNTAYSNRDAQLLYKLSKSQEFREKYYPAFSYDFSNMTEMKISPLINKEDISDYDDSQAFYNGYINKQSLTEEQLNELLNSYRADCKKYSLDEINDLLKKEKLICIYLTEKEGEEINMLFPIRSKEAQIYLCPEFSETLESLKRISGVDPEKYFQ